MKLYCCHTNTPSYEDLLKKWFLSSLKDDYEIILKPLSYKGKPVLFKDENWSDIMREKAQLIVKAIQDNWGKPFIYSDPDVQFFKETKSHLLKALKNKDLVAQCDDPQGALCAGFFICRGNNKTVKLWQDVIKFITSEYVDQDILNQLLLIQRKSFLGKLLVKYHYRAAIKSSQHGLNDYKVKWGYLPMEFFSGGALTGKLWRPGMDLPVPENIIMHHANWTRGVENKIAQLNYVRNIVNARTKRQGCD